MRIEVTQRHIEAGARRSCFNCPVALAILEATGAAEVAVSGFDAGIWMERGQPEHVNATLSADVAWWIRKFDGGLVVEPFSFELELPGLQRKGEE